MKNYTKIIEKGLLNQGYIRFHIIEAPVDIFKYFEKHFDEVEIVDLDNTYGVLKMRTLSPEVEWAY